MEGPNLYSVNHPIIWIFSNFITSIIMIVKFKSYLKSMISMVI